MSQNISKQQAPLYVFVYDISNNKERTKVDDVLRDYGFRVQKSVYECHLTRGDKKRLLDRLDSLNIETGHIRCYSATSNVLKIGMPPEDLDEEYIYFIE